MLNSIINCSVGSKTTSLRIKKFKIKQALNLRKHVLNLKQKHFTKIKSINLKYENLTVKVTDAISYLVASKSYRGTRHKLGYPCRGQRTHTNAKTAKKKKFSTKKKF